MANGWGGRRSGTGLKTPSDTAYYERKKSYVRQRIEPDFAAMVDAQVAKALNGDLDSFKALLLWAGALVTNPDTLVDNSSTTIKVIHWPAGPWDTHPQLIEPTTIDALPSSDDPTIP